MQSWLASCSLDEKYYSQLDQNTVYGSEEGFQGLVNACYENLYYIYGKIDGIGITLLSQMGFESITIKFA